MEPTLNATNNHNYYERIQSLVRNEIQIEIRETELGKRSAKIHQRYLNAKGAVMKQKQEIEKLAHVVGERKSEVEDRESFLVHVQATLDAARKSNASKRNLLEQRKSTVRQHNNELLECMHTLKETTGIYINHGAMPDREKGVIMVEDKCIPFNYPAAANGEFLEILKGCGNCNPNKWLNLLTAGPEVEDSVESSRKAHVAETAAAIGQAVSTKTVRFAIDRFIRCLDFQRNAYEKLTELLFAICAIIFLYLAYRYVFFRPDGFPPGPPRIPIFGSYLFLMLINFKYLHKAALTFSKWYKSDIIGLYVGKFPVAVVHSGEGVREVLTNQAFDGRPALFVAAMRDPCYEVRGIFFQEGLLWKEQRRFILRYLRDFGFGRRFNELELVIKEQITDMLDLIRNGPRYEHEHQLVKPGGYRVQLPLLFNPFSANSVFHIMYNERLPRSDMAKLVRLIQLGMQFQRNGDDYGRLLSIVPWIRYIWPESSGFRKLNEANKFIYKYFEEFIDHHIDTYDESCERNFLDLYITEMKKCSCNGFNREQFIMGLIDFSFPAFTAVGVQLSFLVQYLMLYPEVMKRMQEEVDEVVGCGRLPTLEDRKNMPYTEATIREGLRIETLVPSDVPHKALVDTELMGHRIPKDTIVIPSLYAYHTDSRIWSDPQEFRPERFLDEQGKLCLKLDVSFPFGAGKRLCAGETFARNMLFLMTAAMCQHFNFTLAPGDQLPDLSKNLNGLIITPPDFWVQLEERQH